MSHPAKGGGGGAASRGVGRDTVHAHLCAQNAAATATATTPTAYTTMETDAAAAGGAPDERPQSAPQSPCSFFHGPRATWQGGRPRHGAQPYWARRHDELLKRKRPPPPTSPRSPPTGTPQSRAYPTMLQTSRMRGRAHVDGSTAAPPWSTSTQQTFLPKVVANQSAETHIHGRKRGAVVAASGSFRCAQPEYYSRV